jgi:hypothetical protein
MCEMRGFPDRHALHLPHIEPPPLHAQSIWRLGCLPDWLMMSRAGTGENRKLLYTVNMIWSVNLKTMNKPLHNL